MNESKALRPDPVLLAKCQRIFGAELVVGAWVTTYDFGNSAAAEIKERLDSARFAKDDGKAEISYDGQDIVVEFSGGKKVVFQNSEWATMFLLNQPTYLA